MRTKYYLEIVFGPLYSLGIYRDPCGRLVALGRRQELLQHGFGRQRNARLHVFIIWMGDGNGLVIGGRDLPIIFQPAAFD